MGVASSIFLLCRTLSELLAAYLPPTFAIILLLQPLLKEGHVHSIHTHHHNTLLKTHHCPSSYLTLLKAACKTDPDWEDWDRIMCPYIIGVIIATELQ